MTIWNVSVSAGVKPLTIASVPAKRRDAGDLELVERGRPVDLDLEGAAGALRKLPATVRCPGELPGRTAPDVLVTLPLTWPCRPARRSRSASRRRRPSRWRSAAAGDRVRGGVERLRRRPRPWGCRWRWSRTTSLTYMLSSSGWAGGPVN